MTDRQPASADSFYALVVRYLDNQLDAAEISHLEARLANDESSREVFLDVSIQMAMLAESPTGSIQAFCGVDEVDAIGVIRVQDDKDTANSSLYIEYPAQPVSPLLAPSNLSCVLGNACHGAINYFSSGWPLAYLVTTVIFAVGGLIGYFTPASLPSTQVGEQSVRSRESNVNQKGDLNAVPKAEEEIVGRITGLVDCKWGNPPTADGIHAMVPLYRRYVLVSGMMEITYNTGAKIVLQGPCVYTVESKTGGYLQVGKLTARVENALKYTTPNASVPKALFTVHTPTATVTDLGTEFGVEVDKTLVSRVFVFQGMVDFAKTGASPKETVRLTAGKARQLRNEKNAKQEVIDMDYAAFTKSRAILTSNAKKVKTKTIVLFEDHFDNFVLGKQWKPTKEKCDNITFEPVRENGIAALRIKNDDDVKHKAAADSAAAIETVAKFSCDNLFAIHVDVDFRADNQTPFEVQLIDERSRYIRMYLQPHKPCCFSSDYCVHGFDRGDCYASSSDVYHDGGLYRLTMSIDRFGAKIALQDGVSFKPLDWYAFRAFTLQHLGDKAWLKLRCLRFMQKPGGYTVYKVSIRGEVEAENEKLKGGDGKQKAY